MPGARTAPGGPAGAAAARGPGEGGASFRGLGGVSRHGGQRVSVTLRRPRGWSGSSPRARARATANICPGNDRDHRRHPLRHPRRERKADARAAEDPRVVGDREELRAPLLELGGELGDVGEDPAGGRHQQHREALVDHRHRPVQEVGGRVGLGDEVARLLHLQGHLEGGGVVEAAPHDGEVVGVAVALHLPLHPRVRGDRLLDQAGDGGELRPPRLAPLEGRAQHGERAELGRVGLGRGHRPLLAGEQRQRVLGRRRERRAGPVGDGEGERTLLPPRLDHGHDVGRLARLADPDDQRPRERGRRVVEGEQRRRRQAHRQAVVGAEEVLRVAGGVVGAAARRDDDVARAVRPDPGGRLLGRGPPFLQQAGESPGLLRDLRFDLAHGGTLAGTDGS